MLTGNKDVDRKILNELEDKDLVRACQVNKQAQSVCNNQVFWMNRVYNKFGYVGGDILRKNKGNRSWSEYYIHDLRKIHKTNDHNYLMIGSEKGRLDYTIIALKNGVDIHLWGDKPLRSASLRGYFDVVKYLIEHGADIHANNDWSLVWAGAKGHLEIVKYLIENGADISADNNRTLLLSSRSGELSVVKYLVENGADIHAENDQALKLATLKGHLEVVKYIESL